MAAPWNVFGEKGLTLLFSCQLVVRDHSLCTELQQPCRLDILFDRAEIDTFNQTDSTHLHICAVDNLTLNEPHLSPSTLH